jgi:hypothetical protein
MAGKQMASGTKDFMTAYRSMFFELPLAGMRWGLGLGGEKEALEKAWKGYDATVRMATANIDNMYRTPLFGEAMARSVDTMLRWQRMRTAMAGAFFAGLWQAVGLPTATETRALRSEVQALRQEIRLQRVGLQVKVKRKETQTRVQLSGKKKAAQSSIKGNGAAKGNEGIDINQAAA